jgi:hypothetical protein
LKTVTTNHVERRNLSDRLFTHRFTRLTLGCSKKLANLKHAVALPVAFQQLLPETQRHRQRDLGNAGRSC